MQSDNNPYRSPQADLGGFEQPQSNLSFAAPAAAVGADRGTAWIGEGWRLFMKSPGLWIAVILLFMVISFVASWIPLIGSIAQILFGPSLMVGLFAFAHALDTEGKGDINHMFDGFRSHLSDLVIVGLLYLAMIVGIILVGVILAFVILGSSVALGQLETEQGIQSVMQNGGMIGFLLIFLVCMLLMIPVFAAYWFAPALVFFADLKPLEAMKASFAGCFRNWLPMLIFGIVAFILLVIGMLPLLLGLLVVGPMLCAANYVIFKDLYGKV